MQIQQSDRAPFLFTVRAPPEAVPCSCGGVYTTGGTVRSHLHYIKKHRADEEAQFLESARMLAKHHEILVYQHPEPKK